MAACGLEMLATFASTQSNPRDLFMYWIRGVLRADLSRHTIQDELREPPSRPSWKTGCRADSVVRHLKGETKLIAHHASLAEIPALWTTEERIALIKADLADTIKPRPSHKTLGNKIQSAFENKAEPEFIEKTIKSFVQSGILEFTETDKVIYKAE